jgi:L-ascorbate metabolism protein UlaG (beta-lactamase superfamily)
MVSILVMASTVNRTAADEGEGLWEALMKAPPSVSQSKARQEALQALDDWIAQPDSEQSPELIAYYRKAVDHVLTMLDSERPKKGVRYFQLYSSSAVFQTPSCTFAIDLDQGPNKGLLKTPEEDGTAFCMTDEQVARMAGLVDYSFHTHEHSDHIDYELTQALLEREKTVVVTESNKERWADQPWADRLVTLRQTIGSPRRVGDLKVHVLWDHQWNNEEHTSGTPCNAYVITTPDGVTVATKGDINCALRFYGWLNVLADGGATIDLMVGSPLYWRGANLNRQIDALMAPIWAPAHNWEFEHRRAGEAKGNASPFLYSCSSLDRAVTQGGVVVLSWGEHLDIRK